MNSKVKAYTLMEMIIVMIVSVIIVSMVFVVFMKVNVLAVNLKKMYNKNFQLMLFNKLLDDDVFQAHKIVKTDQGFQCIVGSEVREYVVTHQLIRKQNQLVDTFSLIVLPQVNYTFVREGSSFISEIEINAQFEQEPVNLLYTKEYGADILMNEEHE